MSKIRKLLELADTYTDINPKMIDEAKEELKRIEVACKAGYSSGECPPGNTEEKCFLSPCDDCWKDYVYGGSE